MYEVDGKEAQAGDVFRGCISSLCKQQNWGEAATLLLQFGAVCDKTKAVSTQNKCYLGGCVWGGGLLASTRQLPRCHPAAGLQHACAAGWRALAGAALSEPAGQGRGGQGWAGVGRPSPEPRESGP
jgi:hypothetical protein